MEITPKHYQIHIQGKVPERWRACLDPFTITYLADGDTLLEGQIVDQSQLVGIINQIHGFNLKLISVGVKS